VADYTPKEITDALAAITTDPIAFGRALGYSGTAGGRKQFGRLHRDILEHAYSQPKTSTVVSRGHAKSTILSVVDTAWTLLHDPGARILIACASLDLAKKLVGEVRDRLMGELEILPGLHIPLGEIFPHLEIHGSGRGAGGSGRPRKSGPCEAFNIVGRTGRGREPSVFAASVQSNLAGNHPTHAVIDDPANEQNSRTFARRRQIIDFIEQLEPLMYAPDSPIKHIGTPWAFSDVISYLAEREDWAQFRFGCWDGVNPDTGERDGQGPGPDGGWPLAPSFLNAEEIKEKQYNLSKQFFAAQYLCDPIPAEDALFDDNLILAATDSQLSLNKLPAGPELLLWDPVGRIEGTQGDRNGIIIVRCLPAKHLGLEDKFEKDRNIFIPIYAHEVTGGADAAAAHIEEFCIPNYPSLKSIWVEKYAAQALIVPWMEERGRLGGVRIRAHKMPQVALPYRLQGCQTGMRKGFLRLLSEFPGREKLVQRLTEFPLSDSDDLPAALAMLSTHIERRGNLPGIKLQATGESGTIVWRSQLKPRGGPDWP
jgi:hypothetical protein